MDNMFISCPVAHVIRNILKCAFSLPDLPGEVHEIWSSWIDQFDGITKKFVFWSIWNVRNGACINIKYSLCKGNKRKPATLGGKVARTGSK